jgi:hypothetical protein
MKISHKELKELFGHYLEDKLPIARAKCPFPEDITACLRGEIPTKRRNQTIDHILHCVLCHNEFEFALETIREEKRFIHDLGTIILGKKHKKKKKYTQLFAFRPSWLYSLILITVVVMIILLVKNISEEHTYRGIETQYVMLISPNKITIPRHNLKFEWEHVQNSDYYILEIFNESLYPIWKSKKITDNYTLLSKEITRRFPKDQTYYWMITAFLSDGKTIESRLKDFNISD